MGRSLPVLQNAGSRALRPDGGRDFVVPADVEGKYQRRRHIVFAALITLLALLPWLQIGGHPAVFLDLAQRSFYLFGATFNAQDTWLLFFAISGGAFGLIVVTALWGRLFCGYVCPQTVFLEGVYRRVERWIEGPRNLRLKRDQGDLTFARVWRKVLKHALFLLISFLIAHLVLSYFVSLPAVFQMVRSAPAEHPEAFAWAFGVTALLYGNFAWFREQMCLIICPYGRLQSALSDADTSLIGYDVKRGEPRGKLAKVEAASKGDCVDCGRCVVVCPTGIDIRNGLQLDCIGCAACVDACDEVMTRVGRAPGLIRYDSQRGLSGEPRRFLRPRLWLYVFLAALGLLVSTLALRTRVPFEANLLRLPGAPFVLEEGNTRVRNALELHLVNKQPASVTFELTGEGTGISYVFGQQKVKLSSLRAQRVPVFVTAPNDGRARSVRIRVLGGGQERLIEGHFVAPR